jgi:hypothetical protein
MLRNRSLRWLSCVAALALLADLAPAQGLSVRFGKHSKRSSVSLTLGLPAPHCAPARVWVEGCYEVRVERVWVDGCERQEWVAPCYETRWDSCGRRVKVLVRAGYWRTVREPGRFENREVRVWRPGYWREVSRY